jgi:2-amino-4-hydroxy-6-hydroxymethyldihydropteridine diphosphokinase
MKPMDELNPDAVAFVAVGSNIEPQINVPAALNLLRQYVTVTGISTFCRTEPIGPSGQPPYVNGIWQIHTALSPWQVGAEVLRPIESQLGRIRTADRFAPRPIDLDLILYSDLILKSNGIELPHPDISRPFVWMPILELLNTMPLDPTTVHSLKTLLPSNQDVSGWGIPLGALTQALRMKIQP